MNKSVSCAVLSIPLLVLSYKASAAPSSPQSLPLNPILVAQMDQCIHQGRQENLVVPPKVLDPDMNLFWHDVGCVQATIMTNISQGNLPLVQYPQYLEHFHLDQKSVSSKHPDWFVQAPTRPERGFMMGFRAKSD